MHNLNYDARIIIENIKLNSKNIKKAYIIEKENNIYSISFKINKKKIEFRCSYKMIPISIKKIAEKFNISEKKKDINFNIISWEWLEKKENISLVKKYCKNDVVILKKSLEKFREEVLNNYSIDIYIENIYSLSSLSHKIFFENFNKYKVKSDEQTHTNIIRQAYFGGRCEVFGNLKENEDMYYFDFESMYPTCQAEEKFPIEEGTYIINPKKINFGIYNIDFISNINIPVLPVKHNNKLLFPNGKNLNGTYFSKEIILFLENSGIIKKINWGIEWNEKKTYHIFEDFVKTFKEKRKENKDNKIIYKNLMNSLYGRFAIRNSENEIKFIFNKYEEKWELQKVKKEKKDIESNIILSVITTSAARIKLYKSFIEVYNNKGRVLYCDTDSIFAAFKKDEDLKKMKWNLLNFEKKNEKIFFISPKAYIIGEDAKIKGLKLSDNIIKKNIIEKTYDSFIKNIKMYISQIRIKKYNITKLKNESYIKEFTFENTKRIWRDKKKLETDPIEL